MENPIEGTRATKEEWTDEKHNMYIKSIEASFVNELYDSKQMNMKTSFSNKGNSYESTTGQFKVHRGGYWQKMNFERENPQRRNITGLTSNPWIQHYRSSTRNQNSSFNNNQRKEITLHACDDQDMLCDDTEVSDQNFVDEEEVKSEKETSTGSMKRQRSFDD